MRVIAKDRLYQITFMPIIFPVNCYLVDEVDGFTLIDAALPGTAQPILRAAARLGKPIRRIVLTHAHDDHVGALDALKEQNPDLEVYISTRDACLLKGDTSLLPGEHDTPIKGGVPKKLKTRADVLLSEGDRIGSLEAISVPGHTPGSMAFLDIRTRALIVGDAFCTRGGTSVSGKLVPIFPFPALATWSKAEAWRSADKLLTYSPTLLCAGHGPMVEEPLGKMRQAVAEAGRHFVS
ncbi:putative metallo-hydrolase YflN [compost metagenome]